jgi:hypothetical protein
VLSQIGLKDPYDACGRILEIIQRLNCLHAMQLLKLEITRQLLGKVAFNAWAKETQKKFGACYLVNNQNLPLETRRKFLHTAFMKECEFVRPACFGYIANFPGLTCEFFENGGGNANAQWQSIILKALTPTSDLKTPLRGCTLYKEQFNQLPFSGGFAPDSLRDGENVFYPSANKVLGHGLESETPKDVQTMLLTQYYEAMRNHTRESCTNQTHRAASCCNVLEKMVKNYSQAQFLETYAPFMSALQTLYQQNVCMNEFFNASQFNQPNNSQFNQPNNSSTFTFSVWHLLENMASIQ